MSPAPSKPPHPRLPAWFRKDLPAGGGVKIFSQTVAAVHDHRLHTVCEEAKCPNLHDCWSRGTATFMIAGQSCTRDCRFCSVEHDRRPPPPDPDEPQQLAEAIAQMKLDLLQTGTMQHDPPPLKR